MKSYQTVLGVISLLVVFSAHSFSFTQVDIPSKNYDSKDSLKLTIHASASLKEVLTPILQEFETPENVVLQVIYTASTFSAKQIEIGSPIDIIISANSHDMDQLERLNWVSGVTPLWENRLALVKAPVSIQSRFGRWNQPNNPNNDEDSASATAEGEVNEAGNAIVPAPSEMLNFDIAKSTSWEGLLSPEKKSAGIKRIALADPLSSALGVYTDQAMTNLKLDKNVLAHGIYFFDSQITLSKLNERQADYAIVFYSDAQRELKEQIITIIPNDLHSRIIYQFAQVKQTQPESKQKVIDSLKTYLADTSVSIKMLDSGFTLALPDFLAPTENLPLLENSPENGLLFPLPQTNLLESEIEIPQVINQSDTIVDIPQFIQPAIESTEKQEKEIPNE